MGYIMYGNGITFTELLIIYILMGVCSTIVYIMGVGRGLFLYAVQRKDLDKFVKKLLEYEKKYKEE